MSGSEDNLWSLYYWRDKGVEVDLVLDRKTDVLPIEIKCRNNTKPTNLPAFRKAFPDIKAPVSVVITKDRLDKEQETLYIPFWLAK